MVWGPLAFAVLGSVVCRSQGLGWLSASLYIGFGVHFKGGFQPLCRVNWCGSSLPNEILPETLIPFCSSLNL